MSAPARSVSAMPSDAWVLVTGGSRGIGAATARTMASRGWHVAIAYLRDEAAAERVAEDVRRVGRRVLLHRCNLTRSEECRELIDRLRAEAGTLRGLVHCAGLGAPAPVIETRPNRWRLAWESHVAALIDLVSAGRDTLERGAGIVAVSSLGARRVMPGYGSIAAAKGALEALVRYLAVELADRGINVNAVCGGPVDTDSLRSFPFFEAVEAECRRRPCGRLGAPDDLAKVIAFLLDTDAAWIRGQVIVADGGLSLV